MQLNNPIFINQTDADIRYVNTINNQNIVGEVGGSWTKMELFKLN